MSSTSIAGLTFSHLPSVGSIGSDNAKTAGSTGSTGQDSFSQVFQKTNDNTAVVSDSAKETRVEEDSPQSHANIQKKNAPEQLQEKPKENKATVEEEQLLKAAEEVGVQMVQQVAEILQLTVEEVEQAMEDLGLTPLDLFDGEKLTQLVLQLNPEADALTLVTDEQLFTNLKNLMATAEDLMNQLAEEVGLPREELTEMLPLLGEQKPEEAPKPYLADRPEEVPSETAKPMKAMEPEVEVEAEPVPVRQTDSDNRQQLQMPETATKTAESQPERSQNKAESGRQESGRQETGENFTINLLNQLSKAVEEAGKGEVSYRVSGQDIINQITEQIKVSIKADTTQMELQLNPASLGSLKVQIASKAGVLTATFITQNEAVKAALEGQMVQLKENFEQQGLKVEAVEVNVEARGFERSLDQQEKGQNSFQEKPRKNGRKISLINPDGAEEELLPENLSEEDRIVADMMLRNGNTVDYTA
ncbi:MAG: flagellar hook-length control protein FliK [Lachnospiraceae bacterium]